MQLGMVKGQVVSTVRNSGLPNLTFLLVDIVDPKGKVLLGNQVAVDSVGVGEGEMVLLVQGSSARLILEKSAPIDLGIVGIVDQVTTGKTTVYSK